MGIVCQTLLPAALTTVYQVPKDVLMQELGVYLCNQNVGDREGTFVWVALARQGQPDTTEQYLYHKYPIAPSDTKYCEMVVEAGDVVRMQAATPYVSCTIMALKTEQRQGGSRGR